MKIDLTEIKNLINNGNLADVSRETGIPKRTLQDWKYNKNKWLLDVEDRLSKLQHYIGGNDMYTLIVKEEGALQTVEGFDTFVELKNHLIETDYFSWINDTEPDVELPYFTSVESVEEIQSILEEYDYSWWTMEVVTND